MFNILIVKKVVIKEEDKLLKVKEEIKYLRTDQHDPQNLYENKLNGSELLISLGILHQTKKNPLSF